MMLLPFELDTPKRELRLGATEIPRRFWDTSFDKLDDVRPVREVRNWVEGYLFDGLDQPSRGLTIGGAPGVGKTLAVAVAGVLIQDARRSRVRYITMAEYVRRQLRMIRLDPQVRVHDPDAVAEWQKIDRYFESLYTDIEVLIVDDLGKEHATATGFNRDEFHHLLRTRWDHDLTTLITTNLTLVSLPKTRSTANTPPVTLASTYGLAMADFLKEATTVVQLPVDLASRRC